MIRLAGAAALALTLSACTTVVRCPDPSGAAATVLLLAHGKSSSLVLPEPADGATRWAFGDWEYYALGDKDLGSTLAAAVLRTPAALGRQEVEAISDSRAALASVLGIGIDEVSPLRVAREAVARLRERLEARFQANVATLHDNPGPRLEFVRPPESYTLVNSSNRKVASWIRELGCSTSGITMLSRWRVE
ncbi:MAG: hypothetical protein ACRD2J_06220 [Thermoanaerobaculia bacterium]